MNRWHRDPRVLARRSGGAFLLLPPDQQDPLLLDGAAGVIWGLLDEPLSEAELVERVQRSFLVERSELQKDLAAFMQHLQSLGAVEPC
jgi:hypothetical protein